MSDRKEYQPMTKAKEIAFCGMAAALSTVFLMMTGLIPALGYTGPILASILLVPVRLFFGRKNAFFTWITVSLLVLLIGADKESALFYIFFGNWPVLKPVFDAISPKALQRLMKLLYFFLLAVLMDFLLIRILGLPAAEGVELVSPLVFEAVFCFLVAIVMVIFDFFLSRLPDKKWFQKKLPRQ